MRLIRKHRRFLLPIRQYYPAQGGRGYLAEALIASARNNPFGQTAEQRKNFMGWQDYLLNEARKYQPVIIELRKVDDIYTKVLGEIGKRPSR